MGRSSTRKWIRRATETRFGEHPRYHDRFVLWMKRRQFWQAFYRVGVARMRSL